MQKYIFKIPRFGSIPSRNGNIELPKEWFQYWFRADPDSIMMMTAMTDEYKIGGIRMQQRCCDPEISPAQVRELIRWSGHDIPAAWMMMLIANNPSFALLTLEEPALLTELLGYYCAVIERCLRMGITVVDDRHRIVSTFYRSAWAAYGTDSVIASVIEDRIALQEIPGGWRAPRHPFEAKPIAEELSFLSLPDVFSVVLPKA